MKLRRDILVDMLLVLLLVAHARADWVEITQLHKPSQLTDTLEFHDEKRRLSFSKESNLNSEKRAKPLPSTTDLQRFKPQFSTVPDDVKRFKPHFSIETYDENTRHPTRFSTEPGFLADYKLNRIYINHSIDHSSENHWTKGVVHRVPNPTIGGVKRIHSTTEEPAKVKYEETDLTHELTRGYTNRNPFKTFEDIKPEFVTKEETFEDDGEDEVHFVRNPPTDTWGGTEENPKKYRKNSPIRRVDIKVDPEITKTPSETPKDDLEEPTVRPTEPNLKEETTSKTMENVIKFAKVVADTISRNTQRSVSSKLRYLEDLKDTIMVNIDDGKKQNGFTMSHPEAYERYFLSVYFDNANPPTTKEDRIESLWPDDTGGGAARRRRWSRSAEARGHVEFPSSESALMTISFLTFAVYLIKLVLQIIQSYKNKTMMVTPAVFAAVGRAASGRQQPSLN